MMSERGCSCHISAPCSYCIEKEECLNCGELVHPDEVFYIQVSADNEGGPYCEECARKWREENENSRLTPERGL